MVRVRVRVGSQVMVRERYRPGREEDMFPDGVAAEEAEEEPRATADPAADDDDADDDDDDAPAERSPVGSGSPGLPR